MTIRTTWQFVGGTGILVHEEIAGETYSAILNAAAAFAGALCERQGVRCIGVYNNLGVYRGSVNDNSEWLSTPRGADTPPTPQAPPTDEPSSAPEVLNIEAIILDLAGDCLREALGVIETRKQNLGD